MPNQVFCRVVAVQFGAVFQGIYNPDEAGKRLQTIQNNKIYLIALSNLFLLRICPLS